MPDRIEKQTLLHAPRERVWQAISQPKQFGHWFGAELEGDFVPGRRTRGTIVPTQVDAEVARMQEPYRGAALDLDIERVDRCAGSRRRCVASRWACCAIRHADAHHRWRPVTRVLCGCPAQRRHDSPSACDAVRNAFGRLR